MNESLVTFGDAARLVGVITSPAGPSAQTACLLMNAGVIHRIGPHRLNVRLARALAARGVMSLRIDLSGLGDSEVARAGRSFRDQAVADLRAAMDVVEREHGIHRFIVIGVCSGAVNGYATALADARVTGLLMFDGFAFPTIKTRVLRRWIGLRRLPVAAWPAKLASTVLRLVGAKRPAPADDTDQPGDHPTPPQFQADMDGLARRGVALYLGFSGSFLDHYNYQDQMRDAFPSAAFVHGMRCDYLPHVDHTITSLAAQRRFVDDVTTWVVELSIDGQSGEGRAISAGS